MNSGLSRLSGRLLAANVIWNLVGAVLPLAVGFWAIPVLIAGLGKERFGLLTIIWMGIGYFSFFDLGIGRALTKLVAEGIASKSAAETANLITIGLRLMMVLGSIAGLLVMAITPWLSGRILQVPQALRQEAQWSLWILAATLPFVVSSAGQIGILQAYQRFSTIVAVRIPLGIFNFLGPVLILPLTRSLMATTAVIALSRLMAWTAYSLVCRPYRQERTSLPFNMVRLHARHLLGFGGWITISNIIGPMMVYFDRFFVSALTGLAAVAYYTTPYEIISRISIIPTAIGDVLFPAFAMSLTEEPHRARIIFIGACIVQMSILMPIIGLIVLFAPEGLRFWLGQHFSVQSTPVLRWLALGIFINSFARLPFALLQAHHRPDLTAKLHMIELPLYVATVYGLTLELGIMGTAMAWTMRVVLDAILLFAFAAKTIPLMKTAQVQSVIGISAASLLLAGLCLLDTLPHKVIALVIVVLASLMIGGVTLFQQRMVSKLASPGIYLE